MIDLLAFGIAMGYIHPVVARQNIAIVEGVELATETHLSDITERLVRSADIVLVGHPRDVPSRRQQDDQPDAGEHVPTT
jgi:hypothetical protein